MSYTLHQGDCLEVLRTLPDASVDAVVTDPPYGLAFMGKRWDYDVPSVEIWEECLRVLKPGGHLLAFAGTRTQHRMAVRIEDAGFEIRDMIAWCFGSGFPKSHDVSKAIDKLDAAEARRERQLQFTAWMRDTGLTGSRIDVITGTNMGGHYTAAASQPAVATREYFEMLRPHFGCDVPAWVEQLVDERTVESENFKRRKVIGSASVPIGHAFAGSTYGGDSSGRVVDLTAPATDDAKRWEGWGTALKPAIETVTFASKPYTDEQVRGIIQSDLFRLEARLWLLSSANAVGKSSTSNQSEYGAACAIAQWSADEITSIREDLCGQMGTSLFALATTTSLNIVSSWRRTLDESWSDGNTSTTETKSSTTTDWKTLRFSLSQITVESIIKACSLPGGFSANASTAESHFNASLLLLQSILTLSVTERAMSQAQREHRDVGVKPNLDPCIMARKPFRGTVAANVLRHGTGAINIDGCRVGENGGTSKEGAPAGSPAKNTFGDGLNTKQFGLPVAGLGRWPANLIHDGSDEVLELFPRENKNSAARFFYCAKASKRDRDEGLDALPEQRTAAMNGNLTDGQRLAGDGTPISTPIRRNVHPTVKPTDLMRYLCRLVTPPGGTVLDPFMGSGSTGKAAMIEGFRFIGIEREPEYIEIARARIEEAPQ